jgi:nucleoside-diphosphate-sugar epimerase
MHLLGKQPDNSSFRMGYLMRVLVTGGAGRLGIDVCNALLKNDFQASIFDLDTVSTRRSLNRLIGPAEIITGDITRPDLIGPALHNVDAVLHMAALLTVNTASNRELATKVNVGGTRNVVRAIGDQKRSIPLIYTSSVAVFGPSPDATSPLDPDHYRPKPKGEYAETKFEAEKAIRTSGIDYVILRLGTHWQNQIFSRNEFRYMFRIPLNNRIEIVHPDDTATAIVHAVRDFDKVKGNTFVVSGGAACRMLHRDRVKAITKVLGLPMPPAERFNKSPAPMDWYDTDKSQALLQFQQRTFDDCLRDYRKELAQRFTSFFPFLMRYIIGPVLGRLIVRYI